MKIKELHDKDHQCALCNEKANSVIQNGHVQRTYYLCAAHTESIVYPVKVVDLIRLKPRMPNKYTPIRFIFSFFEIAIKENEELIHLSNHAQCTNIKTRTITPDKRNAAEYLLDNPPYNANGCKYQVSRDKRKMTSGQCDVIAISNSAQSNHFSTINLDELYNKLTLRKATWLLPYANSLKKIVISHKREV